jgi:hypothetical protein
MNPKIFNSVCTEMDRRNECDPNSELEAGINHPKELLYSQRMVTTLAQFSPNSSLELQIACRAQHIERWLYPRTAYEAGREGYLAWRKMLYSKHAEITASILLEQGASSESIELVQSIMEDKDTGNGESQRLEDVACLVFLRYYFEPFIKKQSGEKLYTIVRKTWAKMSNEAHEFALKISFPEDQLAVLKKSLDL